MNSVIPRFILLANLRRGTTIRRMSVFALITWLAIITLASVGNFYFFTLRRVSFLLGLTRRKPDGSMVYSYIESTCIGCGVVQRCWTVYVS